jgi:HAD superfamily hydrolase (TIGR01549 family)
MAVEAVLFDLDDTLYDHRHARLAGLRAIRRAEPTLGRFSLDQEDRTFERLLSEIHLSLVLPGKISHDESRWMRMTRFLQEFHLELPRRRIQELIDLRVQTYMQHRRPVPGAAALLRHLRAGGSDIVVVTNNLVSEQEEKLRFMRFDGLIDHLVCSEEVGFTKPDPRIFRAALERAHVTPQTAVMVGDSWDSDVIGATRAGLRAIWFHRDESPVPAEPHADELRSFPPLARAARVILHGERSSRRSPRPQTRTPRAPA